MVRILLLFVLFATLSCNKDRSINPFSMVSVKYIEDEDFVFMETTEGSWNNTNKLAQLTATGYRNERFKLYLPNLTDTGNYPNPSITNIYYTDGADFISYKLNNGFIHISNIDSLSVQGNFQVSLASDFNGSINRIIIGSFGINMR